MRLRLDPRFLRPRTFVFPCPLCFDQDTVDALEDGNQSMSVVDCCGRAVEVVCSGCNATIEVPVFKSNVEVLYWEDGR